VRGRTVIISLVVHAGLVSGLIVAAKERAIRRATAVALAETKKAEKPKSKPQPPPPRPPKVAKALPPPKPAAEPKAAPPAPKVAAPVATTLEMTNADLAPGGIVVPSKAPAPTAAAPAPATKIASAVSEARKQRQKAELGAGPAGDAPCEEEPTKPEPVFKAEIEYTAAARAEGVEGKLKLKLTVSADGAVTNVEVLAAVWPELDAAAVAAAKQWRFKPSMACGKPIDGGTYILARRFELGD
jgi:protein TonB